MALCKYPRYSQKVNSSSGQDQSLRYGALLLWFEGHVYLGRTINTAQLWSVTPNTEPSVVPHCLQKPTLLGRLAFYAPTIWSQPTLTASSPTTLCSYEQILQVPRTQLITGLVASKHSLFSFLCHSSSDVSASPSLGSISFLNHGVMIPPHLCTVKAS